MKRQKPTLDSREGSEDGYKCETGTRNLPYLVPPTLRLPEPPLRRKGEKIAVVGGTRVRSRTGAVSSCHSHVLVSGYCNRADSDPIRDIPTQIQPVAPTCIHALLWQKGVPLDRFPRTRAGARGREGGSAQRGWESKTDHAHGKARPDPD